MARPRTSFSTVFSREVTIDLANVVANTANVVTTTGVKGLKFGYPTFLWAEALGAGLEISNAHCSVAGSLKFTVHNFTGADINPASQVFKVVQI